jgi:hypothetical protein
MNCRTLRRRPGHLPAPEPAAAAGKFAPSSHAPRIGNEKAAASIAAQLRAQIPCSTDPERLEKLACEAESRTRPARRDNGVTVPARKRCRSSQLDRP